MGVRFGTALTFALACTKPAAPACDDGFGLDAAGNCVLLADEGEPPTGSGESGDCDDGADNDPACEGYPIQMKGWMLMWIRMRLRAPMPMPIPMGVRVQIRAL